MPSSSLFELQRVLRNKVPKAELERIQLPMVPEIQLALISAAYPQGELSSSQINELMDNPPYWAFCWASGQVLARYLLDHPELISGKTIVDFGSGSGVVAIAASLAGAKTCIAVDLDTNALLASELNAQLNDAQLTLCSHIETLNICKRDTVLLIADVFYDAENIPLLQSFIREYQNVIIADSRVKPNQLKGVYQTAHYDSCTVPDLDESRSFNSVRLYHSAKPVTLKIA